MLILNLRVMRNVTFVIVIHLPTLLTPFHLFLLLLLLHFLLHLHFLFSILCPHYISSTSTYSSPFPLHFIFLHHILLHHHLRRSGVRSWFPQVGGPPENFANKVDRKHAPGNAIWTNRHVAFDKTRKPDSRVTSNTRCFVTPQEYTGRLAFVALRQAMGGACTVCGSVSLCTPANVSPSSSLTCGSK